MKRQICYTLLFIFGGIPLFFAQSKIDSFLKSSDSLNSKRLKTIILSETVVTSFALIGLNQLWYKEYEKSNFHFINDNAQWLQMDKAGHVFSSYHLGRAGAELMRWSGGNSAQQRLYGAGLGFAFLTAVEVMDGFSAEWGASWGDVLANVSGTTLYISQDLLWHEQRIIPKFSYHQTVYPTARPQALGGSWNEQILKDYNGQTYWLSANVVAFMPDAKIPKWLNVAIGYGAQGMITGDDALVNTVFFPESKRFRQFYLSLDVDLTRIQTQSHVLKTLFSVFNTVKIPAPTLQWNENGKVHFHPFYF